ncbi:hypothetical protein [Sphingopyxis solisilvae]|uniref:hypothetical protein n=1 Tax=Sphingopyxis solisilvae TaxID=1886788 RepID=UPI0018929A57|nr:hypothetical protein [Sphingopyxis solisilvae]
MIPKQSLARLGATLFLIFACWNTAPAQVTAQKFTARQIIDLHLPDRAFEDAIAPTLQRIRDDIEANEQTRALEKKFPGARKARADAMIIATSAIYKIKFDQAVGEVVVELSSQFAPASLDEALNFYQKPHVANFLTFVRKQRPCQAAIVAECERQGAVAANDFFSEARKDEKEDWAAFLSSDAGRVDAFLENLLGLVLDRFAKMPLTPAESEALLKNDRETLRRIQS